MHGRWAVCPDARQSHLATASGHTLAPGQGCKGGCSRARAPRRPRLRPRRRLQPPRRAAGVPVRSMTFITWRVATSTSLRQATMSGQLCSTRTSAATTPSCRARAHVASAGRPDGDASPRRREAGRGGRGRTRQAQLGPGRRARLVAAHDGVRLAHQERQKAERLDLQLLQVGQRRARAVALGRRRICAAPRLVRLRSLRLCCCRARRTLVCHQCESALLARSRAHLAPSGAGQRRPAAPGSPAAATISGTRCGTWLARMRGYTLARNITARRARARSGPRRAHPGASVSALPHAHAGAACGTRPAACLPGRPLRRRASAARAAARAGAGQGADPAAASRP